MLSYSGLQLQVYWIDVFNISKDSRVRGITLIDTKMETLSPHGRVVNPFLCLEWKMEYLKC